MRFDLTLGVGGYVLSYCGMGSIASARLKSHNVGQGVQHRGLCGELLTGHCVRYHSYPHNFDKYSYPSLARHSQRLGIQDFDNPSAWRVSDHPSNSGVTHPYRELDLPCQLQSIWQFVLAMVAYLWASLSMMLKSWPASLGSKGYQLKSAYPYGWRIFWLSRLVAWHDYLSCSLKLNQVAYPYLILPQTGVGCKP